MVSLRQRLHNLLCALCDQLHPYSAESALLTISLIFSISNHFLIEFESLTRHPNKNQTNNNFITTYYLYRPEEKAEKEEREESSESASPRRTHSQDLLVLDSR